MNIEDSDPQSNDASITRVKAMRHFIENILKENSESMPQLVRGMQIDFGFPEIMCEQIIRRIMKAYQNVNLEDISNKLNNNVHWAKIKSMGVVLPGNVPDPLIEIVLMSWLNGASVYLKVSKKTKKFANCFVAILKKVDKEQSQKVRVFFSNSAFFAKKNQFETCIAYGSDQTMGDVRAELGPSIPLERHGNKLSIVILDHQANLEQEAKKLAVDLWLYDQRGCLSPQMIFVRSDENELGLALKKYMVEINQKQPILKRPYEFQLERNIVIQRLSAKSTNQREIEIIDKKSGSDKAFVYILKKGKLVHGHCCQIVSIRKYDTEDDIRKTLSLLRDSIHCIGVDSYGLDKDWSNLLRLKYLKRVCPVGDMQKPPMGWDL